MAKSVLFRCPTTAFMVHGQLQAKEQPRNGMRHYEGVHCTACRSVHLVNPASGRLISEETGKDADQR